MRASVARVSAAHPGASYGTPSLSGEIFTLPGMMHGKVAIQTEDTILWHLVFEPSELFGPSIRWINHAEPLLHRPIHHCPARRSRQLKLTDSIGLDTHRALAVLFNKGSQASARLKHFEDFFLQPAQAATRRKWEF